MKCPCGYDGIPSAHHEGQEGVWVCPLCGQPRSNPDEHDPMPPNEDGKLVCAQCGMWGMKPADLKKTPCPGQPPGGGGSSVAWCLCGEYGPAPQRVEDRKPCKRCGKLFPHFNLPAAEAPRRKRGKKR